MKANSTLQKRWGISDSLLDAVKSVAEKKLDPVGKADDDIDNDGDVDDSDKYLKNRRKAIGKAIKKDQKEEDKEDKKGVNVKPAKVEFDPKMKEEN